MLTSHDSRTWLTFPSGICSKRVYKTENMFTKATLVSLLAIALIAAGGIGYSAFTSTASATANATGGTIGLIWAYGSPDASNPSYATCQLTGSGSAITLTVAAIAPGDGGCLFDVTVQNTGNIPAALTISPGNGQTFGGTDPSTSTPCFTFNTAGLPATLGPGATTSTFYLRISVAAGHSNACAGYSATTSVAVTGTYGT